MAAVASIGIVGGGSVAVSFLAQWVSLLSGRSAAYPLKVLIFEPSAKLGPGGAYSDDINTNLLNIPAGNMSAYVKDRGHFLTWLKTLSQETLSGYGVSAAFAPADFLPRPLFGKYLERVYADTLQLASSSNIEIVHIQAQVVSVSRLAAGAVQIDTGSQAYRVNRVVLCNGNLPSVAFKRLEGCEGFFNSPYPVKNLVDHIDKWKSVCVIGTSLSAVDAVVALKQAGHTGEIICVSRNGRLPAVRSQKNTALPVGTFTRAEFEALAQAHGGTLTLQAVFDKLCDKVVALGGSMALSDVLGHGSQQSQAACQSSPSAQEVLGHEIVRSTEKERIWQSVAASANEVIDFVWHLLPPAEREQFQKQWRSLWMARRATFPMKNALKLQRYFAEGGFRVESGFVRCDHNPVNKEFCVELQDSASDTAGSAGRNVMLCDYVINATSFSVDIGQSSDPLVNDLIASSHACVDPFGGFKLDFDTGCLVNPCGVVLKEMSVLGSLAVGTYFWTISMDVNARLAYEQAHRLAEEILGATSACSFTGS